MATRLRDVTAETAPADPDPAPAPAEPAQLADYRPVELRARHDGWTATRQRKFLTVLAETGSISEACIHSGVSSRSAYRLRQRPDATAFAQGWDEALRLATLRLTTIAFERAVKGTVREVWRDGACVSEMRAPSDRLLMFLLANLLHRPGAPSRLDAFDATLAEIGTRFPQSLDALTDHDVGMVPVEYRDFFPDAPGDRDEDC